MCWEAEHCVCLFSFIAENTVETHQRCLLQALLDVTLATVRLARPSLTALWMDIWHCLTGLIGSWEFNAFSIYPSPMWPCWHLHTALPHYLQPVTDGEQWGFHGVLPVDWKIEAVSKLTPYLLYSAMHLLSAILIECLNAPCVNLPSIVQSEIPRFNQKSTVVSMACTLLSAPPFTDETITA